MKNKLRIITGFIIWAIVSSCSADYDHYIPAPIQIRGTVTDTEGNPVNHIKITFDCGEREASLTVYTSLKGEFIADLATKATIIKINLEDIDGIEKEIRRVCEEKPFSKEACIKRADNFDKDEKFKEYIELY